MGTKLLLKELEGLIRIEARSIAGEAAAEAPFSIYSMGKDGSWILVVPSQAGVPIHHQEALQLAAKRVRINFDLLDDCSVEPP